MDFNWNVLLLMVNVNWCFIVVEEVKERTVLCSRFYAHNNDKYKAIIIINLDLSHDKYLQILSFILVCHFQKETEKSREKKCPIMSRP